MTTGVEEPRLVCRGCRGSWPLGPAWWGCDRCRDAAGLPHWLEVSYAPGALDVASVAGVGSLWDYASVLPVADPSHRVALGAGGTPLVQPGRLNDEVGIEGLHLKLEFVNPTASFKDRSQAVAVSMAKSLGFERVVIASTGNAGVACAAAAAAAGLDVAVVLDAGAPPQMRRLIELMGGMVVMPGGDGPVLAQTGELVDALVRDHGFAPCSVQGTHAGPSNPYGVEGYKTIAFETVAQLGRVPDRVCVPTAGGDALYGIYKGFRELAEAGIIDSVPRMTACQAAGAAFAVNAIASGDRRFEPVTPATFAISIGDPIGSTSILEAVRSSDGDAWAASDDEILDALASLAASGVVAEGGSAAPVAALRRAVEAGRVEPEEVVVAIVTGGGVKWPDQLEAALVRRGERTPLPVDPAVVAAAFGAG